MKEVPAIIKEWLKENGYDGLYVPGECACLIDDFMPCGDPNMDCCAGYKREPEGEKYHEFDFMVGPKREGE